MSESITMEEIIRILEENSIATVKARVDDYGFSRTIKFSVYDTDFYIRWYQNESTLEIGDNKRCPEIKFKYIGLDTTYPLVDGNRSLEFSYEYPFPYHTFRIPLELKEPNK